MGVVVDDASVALAVQSTAAGLEVRSRQLLREGMGLVVEAIALAVPSSVAGVFSVGPSVSLLALALSDVEWDPETSPAHVPPDLRDSVEWARHVAELGGGLTEVGSSLGLFPLRDRAGQVGGLLFVATSDPDTPLGGVGTHALVAAHAAHAQRELRGSQQQVRLDEQARLAEAAHEAVRRATSRLDPAAALPTIEEVLRHGFRARYVCVSIYDPDESDGLEAAPGPEACAEPVEPVAPGHGERADEVALVMSRSVGCALWEGQRVLRVPDDAPYEHVGDPAEGHALQQRLAESGLGSLLAAPVGYQDDCLGHLLLARADTGLAWSPAEARMAREIGRDLGRALHNARALAREQRLGAEMRAVHSAKSKLIAAVSHELRDPLAAIVGHLEMLGSTTTHGGDELRQALAAMGRGTVRLQRVVGDLDLLSRVGDPLAPLPTSEVEVCQLARDAVDLLRVTAQLAGITLEVRLPDRPVPLRGNAAELDRALGNLLTNAVKYGRRGGRVELSVEALDDDEVLVTCSDDGIGIAPEYLPHVFTEFYRAADPRALERNGTGLGLAIVRRIAHRHRGRVEVTSVLGEGSRFELYLRSVTDEAAG